jgi:predicted Zn-dependent protease with MMP-like domain
MTRRRQRSRRDFERLVLEALALLPEPFQRHLENVSVEVEDWPSPELLAEAEVPEGETLFGIYLGVPLTAWGRDELPRLPDRIIIFRGPIEEACATDEEVVQEVRTTVLHEVGHHFGLSDEELERWERSKQDR